MKSSSKRHDKADDEVATLRPPPTLDELRKSRLEYFSKRPEERRKTMKYVYDEPISTKTRVMKQESKNKRSEGASSKSKDGGSGRKTKRSHAQDERTDSDEDRVYVVRRDSKSEAKPSRSNLIPPDSPLRGKATVTRPQSSKATVSRKPPQRRHTAPAQVIEVDGDLAR